MKSKFSYFQKRPPIQLQPPFNLNFGLTTPFSKNIGPISYELPGNASSNGGRDILCGLGISTFQQKQPENLDKLKKKTLKALKS